MPQSTAPALTGALLLLLVGAPDAAAQAPAPPLVSSLAVTTAPVEVDGVVLFRVRGTQSFPAVQRAAGIADRIRQAAEDKAVDPETIQIVEDENGLALRVGSHGLLYVFAADAEMERLSPRELALGHRVAIKAAIQRYRDARTGVHLGTAALHALVATALFAALLALLLPAFRRLDRLVQRRFKRKAEKLEEKSFDLLRAERLRQVVRGALGVLRFALLAVLFYSYLSYVLGIFPWTRFIAVRLRSWIVTPLVTIGRGALNQVPDLIFLVILFFVVRWSLKLLRLFFHGIDRGSIRFEGFHSDWAWPTYKIVRMAVIAFGVVVAYPYIPGSGSEAFKGVSLFAGVVFSLGSTSAISNIVAGYTMTYRRAFRVGDRIKVGDVLGDVIEIRLLVTTLRTPKNEEVVIPNSTILNSEITNYSSLATDRGLILHTTVGIGYEVPWRQVEAMLLEAAARTPGLPKEPAPFVLQKALADYAVNYELNVYCQDPSRMMPLYTELHRNIQDVFNEYGVQIMTPSYEADTPDPKVVPKDKWYTAPAKPPDPGTGE